MIIKIHEYNEPKRAVLHLEAETKEDCALVMRLGNLMKSPNRGFVSFSGETIHGSITIPLNSRNWNSISSGKTS